MENIRRLDTAAVESSGGYRFIPAPQTGITFETIMNIVRGAAESALGTVPGAVGGAYQDIIAMQLEAQKQMMLVSMVSNVEKSKHETQMAPVRNIRVG